MRYNNTLKFERKRKRKSHMQSILTSDIIQSYQSVCPTHLQSILNAVKSPNHPIRKNKRKRFMITIMDITCAPCRVSLRPLQKHWGLTGGGGMGRHAKPCTHLHSCTINYRPIVKNNRSKQLAQGKKIRKRFGKNADEWTGRVEISSIKKYTRRLPRSRVL